MVLTYYVISQRNNQQPQGTTRTAQASTSYSPPATHTLYTVAMEKLLQVTANTIEHESDSRGYCAQRLRVKIAYNNER